MYELFDAVKEVNSAVDNFKLSKSHWKFSFACNETMLVDEDKKIEDKKA